MNMASPPVSDEENRTNNNNNKNSQNRYSAGRKSRFVQHIMIALNMQVIFFIQMTIFRDGVSVSCLPTLPMTHGPRRLLN